jgi:2-oxoglutarate dehydrogenase E2 component (dihydrolipoamide succinyltransferase)
MIDILVPDEQEGTRAVVRAWLCAPGDRVALNAPLVELETDKVTQEVSAPAAGVLTEILLATDDEALPGAILGRLRPDDGVPAADAPLAPTESAPPHIAAPTQPGIAAAPEGYLSPAVRAALAAHAIDPAAITGTGAGGRITAADVDRAIAKPASPGLVTIIPHDRMRRAIAEHMHHSLATAPHVTSVFEADFTAILAHQAAHKAAYAAQGAKLTLTAYLVAASAAAMRAAPAINSRWHEAHLELIHDANIGIGAALGDKGLVVPVVRRAQTLSLREIAKTLTDLIARARAEQLTPADLRDGSFTISNHGVSGSLLAAPIIINQPQSAILGVGRLQKRVVVREAGGADSIQIRPMSYVSLTIDHRVVDAHQTNAWLTHFVNTLEAWQA